MTASNTGFYIPDCYAEITRPADVATYTTGDVVTDTTTTADVVPLRFPACRTNGGSGIITGGRAIKSSDTTTVSAMRLWLFAASPFAAGSFIADNAALDLTYASMARFVGCVDLTTWVDAGSMAKCEGVITRTRIPFSKEYVGDSTSLTTGALSVKGLPPVPPSRLLYGILEARAAYVPTSAETFRIWLDVQSS